MIDFAFVGFEHLSIASGGYLLSPFAFHDFHACQLWPDCGETPP